MAVSNDKKILWSMGITAFCLVILVVFLVIFLNTYGIQNWKVLLPFCFALGAMVVSACVMLLVVKCGYKKNDS